LFYGVVFHFGVYPYEEIFKVFIQLIVPVILALIFVDYTFHKTNELRFIHALGNLVEEMIDNTTKLTDEAFDMQLKEFPEKIQKKIEGENQWIGFGKSPSFTNWSSDYGNFFRKYLPITNYFYFINQGFFNAEVSSKIVDGSKSHIATVFNAYSKINVNIQQFENILQYIEPIEAVNFRQQYFRIRDSAFEGKDYKEFIEYSISIIDALYKLYPEIDKQTEIVELKEKLSGVLNDKGS